MPLDFDVGDGADALTRDQLVAALDGTYWVSGWDATPGTGDLEVDIAAGEGAINGGDVSTGSTQTVDFTGDPDPNDPRKAVISVDTGGNVVKTLGTAVPADPTNEVRERTWDPQPPAASVPGVVVAEVWLEAGETILESADVRDRRVTNEGGIGAAPNVPNWIEDSNSPIEGNSDSVTYTLDGEYDQIKIIPDTSTFGFDLAIRVNGDTGTNYEYIQQDDTRTTNADSIVVGANAHEVLEITLTGRGVLSSCGVNIKPAASSSGITEYGKFTNLTGSVDTITLFSDNGIAGDYRFRVYGLEV